MPLSSAFVSAFESLMRQAGDVAVQARRRMVPELKPDGSIVTNGDREAETYLREVLPKLRPGSSVWGEEFGYSEAGPGGLWLVDPVDGTSNFSFGSPLWGVSVALLDNEELTIGGVYLPDLDELYVGARGQGATCNGQKLAPIPEGPIQKHELVSYSETLLKAFPPSQRWPGKMRCSGAFVIDAMFVVRQRFRGLIGIRGQLYDIAASLLIAEELGADVRYLDGEKMTVQNIANGKTIPKPYVIFPRGSDFSVGGP